MSTKLRFQGCPRCFMRAGEVVETDKDGWIRYQCADCDSEWWVMPKGCKKLSSSRISGGEITVYWRPCAAPKPGSIVEVSEEEMTEWLKS